MRVCVRVVVGDGHHPLVVAGARELAARYGVSGFDVTPAPKADEITLRKSRVDVPSALQSMVRTDHLTRLEHSYGKAGFDADKTLIRNLANPALSLDEQRQQLDLLRQAHALEPMNPQTCFSIGEVLRTEAWERQPGYEETAEQAMQWFERAWRLNPYDGYARLRYGMCLDLLGQIGRAHV